MTPGHTHHSLAYALFAIALTAAACATGSPPTEVAPGPDCDDPCLCDADAPDADDDGTPDCADACPDDPNKTDAGTCGCGTADTDADGDTVPDCNDGCPDDEGKLSPGACGCGATDVDTDDDDTPDCADACALDAAKLEPGVCGCGTADADTDGDAVLDCLDPCPDDDGKVAAGMCGCGVAETDCTTLLQAEDLSATLGCVITSVEHGYTGDGYVDFPLTADSWFEWADIPAVDDTYTLIFRYANGANARSVAIVVNGEPVDVVEFIPTEEWSAWGTAAVPVRLRDGANTVRIQAIASYGGPNFDALEIVAGTVTDECPEDPTKIVPGECGCGAMDLHVDDDGIADCI